MAFLKLKKYSIERTPLETLCKKLTIEEVVTILEDSSYYMDYPQFALICDCILFINSETPELERHLAIIGMNMMDGKSYDTSDRDQSRKEILQTMSFARKNFEELMAIPLITETKHFKVLLATYGRTLGRVEALL